MVKWLRVADNQYLKVCKMTQNNNKLWGDGAICRISTETIPILFEMENLFTQRNRIAYEQRL